MSYLALDLSITRTGYALWDGESEKPIYGGWSLRQEQGSRGDSYRILYRKLNELYGFQRFDTVYFEQPIDPRNLNGLTNFDTVWLAFGLASHVQSFASAKRCRKVVPVNISEWRKSFIGDLIVREVAAQKRRNKKNGIKPDSVDPLKRLCVERCLQLGMNPKKHDDAEAIGVLTAALLQDKITPPWLANETLRAPLMGAAK